MKQERNKQLADWLKEILKKIPASIARLLGKRRERQPITEPESSSGKEEEGRNSEVRTLRRKKIRKILGVLFVLLLCFSGFELWISKYGLVTTEYTIQTDEIAEPFRIVQLTDLHNSVFGENNSRLVEAVRVEEPDLILFTGDLVNSKSGPDTDIATELISSLCEIAPVYVSYGNQEKELEESYDIDLTAIYTEAGAIVLEKEYLDTEIKGTPVRIGGIYGYCQCRKYGMGDKWIGETSFLEEFEDTDRYTILMCHMPVSWVRSISLYDWNIDVVFSGHAHGGQVRIPFIGGLWAPDQGWFPGRECGIYETNEEEWQAFRVDMKEWADSKGYDIPSYADDAVYEPSYLVLSRGLGNTDKLPRFNNVPEVVSVDFTN